MSSFHSPFVSWSFYPSSVPRAAFATQSNLLRDKSKKSKTLTDILAVDWDLYDLSEREENVDMLKGFFKLWKWVFVNEAIYYSFIRKTILKSKKLGFFQMGCALAKISLQQLAHLGCQKFSVTGLQFFFGTQNFQDIFVVSCRQIK